MDDSFGRPQAVSGGSADPFQYKSEYGYRGDGDGNITGQGLYKVGARYYDPLFGRFISRDSDLDQSPYSYCDGDPLNEVDPTGHKGEVSFSLSGFLQFIFGSGGDLSINVGPDGVGASLDGWGGLGMGSGSSLGFGFNISNGNAASNGPFGFADQMGYMGDGVVGSLQAGISSSGGPLSYSGGADFHSGIGGGFGGITEEGAGYSVGVTWGQIGNWFTSANYPLASD